MELEKLVEVIKNMPIEVVGELLKEARYSQKPNQEAINILANEVARRLYKGNQVITYESFRANFGYVDTEIKHKSK